jgi:pSer/pThr/pTyr-binding forkhead associated (FHA) protein
MELSLIVLNSGRRKGRVIPIPHSPFFIGRDPDCHLRPASPVIGKRQCALWVRDDRVFLEDFNSTNGTLVNDRQIKGEIELLNGDRLKIGPLVFGVCIDAGISSDVPRSDNSEDAAAAALLSSLSEEQSSTPVRAVGGGHDTHRGTTVQEVITSEMINQATPPPDKPFGSVSSAKEILRKYKRDRPK